MEELLLIDVSTYKPFKSDEFCEHPLRLEALRVDLPPASAQYGRGGFANAALLYAIIQGKVDMVRIMAKYLEVNIDDVSGRPLLHYVYLLDQQDARRQILDILVPKLQPTINNLCMAAKHGDLKSTKCFAERLEGRDLRLAVDAASDAILNGHDDIAKWIIETPGITDWTVARGSLVYAAVDRNNFDMVEYLSTHSPPFPLGQFGYATASDLWAFLRRVHRPELFGEFVPSCPEGYTLPFSTNQ